MRKGKEAPEFKRIPRLASCSKSATPVTDGNLVEGKTVEAAEPCCPLTLVKLIAEVERRCKKANGIMITKIALLMFRSKLGLHKVKQLQQSEHYDDTLVKSYTT